MSDERPFIERLPAALHERHRLILEAVRFSHRAIEESYARLLSFSSATIERTRRDERGNYREVQRAILDAWTIVEQTYLLRHIAQEVTVADLAAALAALLESTKGAPSLRNTRTHFRQQLTNLSNRSGRPPPLFGALHVMHPEEIPKGGVRINHVLAMSAAGPQGWSSYGPAIDTLNPPSRPLVEFEAFDTRVNFTDWVAVIDDYVTCLSNAAERGYMAATADVPEEMKEEILRPTGADGVVVMTLDLLPHGEG